MQGVKRLLDILAAGIALCLLSPLMLLLALLVLGTEGRPLLYREQRVGRGGTLFPLYKFRTMRVGSADERSIGPEDDPRITGAGLWLRRWRLDEFPQLVNVLWGHMSLVGPRPMPPVHAREIEPQQLAVVLSVRPGITDPAAIHFLAEDAVLAGEENAETLYFERFLPAKTDMQIDALQQWSFTGDLGILAETLRQLWSRDARQQSAHAMRKLLAGVTPRPVESSGEGTNDK